MYNRSSTRQLQGVTGLAVRCNLSRNHRVKGLRLRTLQGVGKQRKGYLQLDHCAVELQFWRRSKAELVSREGNLSIDLLFLRLSDRRV